MLRLPTVAHRNCSEFGPVAVKALLIADGKPIASIDTFDQTLVVPLGSLELGAHTIELSGIEANCKSFSGMPVPIRLPDTHCALEFNVSSPRTFTITLNASDDGAKCAIR